MKLLSVAVPDRTTLSKLSYSYMQAPHLSLKLTRVVLLLLLLLVVAAPVWAKNKKFVYVYDSSGILVKPLNAASHCPDPDGDSSAASICHGVEVDAEGKYSCRFDSKDIDTNNLIFVANEYDYIQSGEKGATKDTYVLLESKRRVDNVEKDKENKGVDINRVSEATVKAVEKVKNVGNGKQGAVSKELAEAAADIDAKKCNKALGNDKEDNIAANDAEANEQELKKTFQEKMNDTDEQNLVDLAEVVVENQGSDDVQNYIRKNIKQALADPASLEEIKQRVFSHIPAIQAAASSGGVIFLEADKYIVLENESASLTTINSIHPETFFAYTWEGVDSVTSTAAFTKTEKGNYLVCATGEISGGSDSSTDCIRMAVRDVVDAVARTGSKRVGTGNTIKLSATLSVGATSYQWSGGGSFATSSAETTLWTAPETPGTYTITLSINDGADTDTVTIEVFDVLPVAIAQADHYALYLTDGSATINLTSGSISTDGSDVDALSWSVSKAPTGASYSFSNSSATTSAFTTDTAGEYTMQLTAEKRSLTDTTSLSIQVRRPDVPVANAGPDKVSYRNQAVTLDGSGSYASQGRSISSYNWSASSGALQNTTSAAAKFTATTLGEYQVTLTVDDGASTADDSVKVSIVNQKPAASDDVIANLLNEILEDKVLAKDGDNDTLTYELVTQPQYGGVTLDSATGEFVYLPGGVKGCQYHPYRKPENNAKGGLDVPVIKLCADKFVAAPGEVINLTTSNSINASKFSGYAWTGGAVGDSGDMRLATYASTEPGFHQICIVGNIGASSNTSTACVDLLITGGAVSSIDDNAETGMIDKFQFKVNDGSIDSNIATVVITIGWENSLPVANDQSITTAEETPVNGTVSAADADAQTLTYSISSNGSLGTAVITDASTGTFTYTPDTNKFGSDSFSFVANDGLENSVAGVVTVTVTNVNDYPLAYFVGSVSTDEDVAVSGTLTGSDPDGDVLEYRLVTIPSKGTVVLNDSATGSFTYTPDPDKNGADSFYFLVNDGLVDSNTARVNINVAPVNDAPVANDQGPFTLHADETFSKTVTATDIEKDALVYKVVSNPTLGTVVLDASTGDYVYTPGGTLGSDSFTFQADDGSDKSNVATVSITVIAANVAPVANAKSIQVFEGVKYTGQLTGSDTEGADLSFSIDTNGKLGLAHVIDAATGDFSYIPHALASGADFFTFKVFDGDKYSKSVTVNVNIIPSSLSCQGPGHDRKDSDGDGYADYVETVFGTGVNNASSTPAGLNPLDYGISFTDDDDSDNYSDINELWLKTDHTSAASKPSDSGLHGVPTCLSALYDSQAPALQAFSILTPTVDLGAGDTLARFALTVIDNAAGLKSAHLKLVSPHGAVLEGTVTPFGAPLVFYGELTSDVFGDYAEDGVWTIAELTLTDARDNQVVLSTADMTSRGYPTALTVVNPNSDIVKPVLSNFEVLTPALDISGGGVFATFRVTASDDLAGIARTAVTLRSPSGKSYRFGEVVRNDNATSIMETINTNAFESYLETGTWSVSELSVNDEAGNAYVLTGSQLVTLGYSIDVEVSGAVVDSSLPVLTGFTLVQSSIDASSGSSRAGFHITATDDLSGIREIVMTITRPCGGNMTVRWSSLSVITSLDAMVYSDVFSVAMAPGAYSIATLDIIDNAGNSLTWSTADLASSSFSTGFVVVNPLVLSCIGVPNSIPVAYPGSFNADEDTLYTGALNAFDSDGDSLSYKVVNKAAHGTVTITNAVTGAFTYLPDENFFGNDVFSFKVDDGSDESNTALVSITVNPLPDPTSAVNMSIQVIRDTLYTGTLNGSDPDGGALTFSIVGNGSLGTATLTNANTGSFVYQPNASALGSDSFTYQVSDSNSISSIVTVNVEIVPDLALSAFTVQTPVVSGKNEFAKLAAAITLTKDISAIAEARISLQGPSGQVIGLQWYKQSGAVYPFVISKNHYTVSDPLEAGTWTFKDLLVKRVSASVYEVVLADLVGEGFAATLEVVDNTSPVAARSDAYTTSLGAVKDAAMTATDAEGDTLTYTILSGPAKGSLQILDNHLGTFRYTPTALGVDTFTFKVNDGLEDSGEGLVTITVNSVNGIPVAHNASIKVTKNLAYVGSMSATDPESDPLTYSVVTQPGKGTVEMTNAATGAFVYRPDADTTGSDSFSFKANDGSADSNTATVSVTIAAPNSKPVVNAASITVFENVVYNGMLSASDVDGDSLTYYVVSNAVLGSVAINSGSGAFTYTPVTDIVGSDSFTVRVFDGVLYSDTVTISVDVISKEQACGTGGVVSGLDADGDGYIDAIEQAFATDPHDAASTPEGLSASDLGILFTDDDDSDTYKDYIEVWMGSDPRDVDSVPPYLLNTCFDASGDGIKPRLIGFKILTPTIDIASGNDSVSFVLSLLDNASGIKRARVQLLSPSGVYVTTAASFTDYPLLTAIRIDTEGLGAYAEQGTWDISGITLYDEAGNRLDLDTTDLTDAGYAASIEVTNSAADTTPPTLDDFTITSPIVYPGTASDHMTVDVTLTDSESGISSVRVDFISATGTIVTASQSVSGSPTTSTLVQLDTGTLSQYLEQGTWTVYGVLLVDSAGNSVQLADQLGTLGFGNTLTVTNPLSDATAPTLDSLSVLTGTVYPATGTARMRFSVTASDNAAGIEKIRIDLTGPSGQILTAWGVFSGTYPLATTSTVETAVLSDLTESGTWHISEIEILDDAGNSSLYSQSDLNAQGYTTSLTVSY